MTKMTKLNYGIVTEIPVESITISALNPRQFVDQAALEELGSSIGHAGVIQPVFVEPKPGGGYELFIGSRRLRATIKAGLTKIPAFVVTSVEDKEKLILALTENLHTEDLTPFEEAWAFLKLVKDFKTSLEEVADRTGRGTQYIRRRIQILSMPTEVQQDIALRRLGIGHVDTLVSLATSEEQIQFAQAAIRNDLSSDDLTMLVKQHLGQDVTESETLPPQRTPTQEGTNAKKLALRILRMAGWLTVMSPSVGRMASTEREEVFAALDKLMKAATKFLTPQTGGEGKKDARRNATEGSRPDRTSHRRPEVKRTRRSRRGGKSRVHFTK